MLKNIPVVLILILVLQSCKVTKDYARPEFNLPTTFDNLSEKTEKKVQEVPSYQHFFADTSLKELLDDVMERNSDLLIASEHILASEAMMKSIKLNYLPDINLQVSAGVQRFSQNSITGSFVKGQNFQDHNFASVVSWDIDFWGKLKRQREEAFSGYLALSENRRALRVQLIAQTAQSYYNLLRLDEQLLITQTVVKSMEETLELLKIQYSVGDVSTLAIKQSEAQLAETKAFIPEIKASIKAQENALQTLVGKYPDSIKRAQSVQYNLFTMELEDGVPVDLLANRPDIKQKEFELQVANAKVGIAKTEFYPTLKITGQGGLNAIKATNWFSIPASLFGNVAAGLTQPIFNRRRIKSTYEAALHQKEAAVNAFRKSVLIGVEEVSTSMSNITQIKEQVIESNNRKTAMNKAIEDAQILFQYGEATYLEVLTVQQSYLQAQLGYAVLIQKEINAYIGLYKALGGN